MVAYKVQVAYNSLILMVYMAMASYNKIMRPVIVLVLNGTGLSTGNRVYFIQATPTHPLNPQISITLSNL